METLQISFNQKIGYLPINKIMAPRMLGRIKDMLTPPVKQKDPLINKINKSLKEDLNRVNAIRTSVGYQLLPCLNIKLNNKIPVKVKFIYDVPLSLKSEAKIAMGMSDVDLGYWFAMLPDDEKLTNCFDDINSYIYKNGFLNSILTKIYNYYIEKDSGVLKLSTSVYKKLEGMEAYNFYLSAIFGKDGTADVDEGSKDNINFFYSGNLEYEMLTPLYGAATISFSESLKTKEHFLKIFNEKKAYLVIEQTQGTISLLKGKRVSNVSIGIYHENYLRLMRHAIELRDNL